MKNSEIARLRLRNQGLAKIIFKDPADAVSRLGAVQSQDYAGAKWALGQRLKDATDASLDAAFNEGKILRTHVMRPTWHFVTPEDIRWMLDLTAPRVLSAMTYMNRQLGLDIDIFKKSNAALAKALQGGNQLTRSELMVVFKRARINMEGLRFIHIMMRAELDQVVCSGGRHGKQFTYALLDERAPQAKPLTREQALAELAMRYFTSHGPATLQDFAWWSGLSMADARRALELIKSQLMQENMDGQTYWFAGITSISMNKSPGAHLLPDYDEYLVGYADRRAVFDAAHAHKLDARESVLAQYTIMIDGQIVGTWKRTLKKDAALVKFSPFGKLTRTESKAMFDAAVRYGNFLDLPVKFV